MSDLLAECDWHDSTLFLVLPEDPERIGVRLFPSRHAPSRMYVPEAEIMRVEAENAKLRELSHLVAEYVSADQCEGCVAKRACNAGELDMCWIRKAIFEKLRDLGVEVEQ